MIIRRPEEVKNEFGVDGEYSIDFERLGYVARRKAKWLVAGALTGFTLGLIIPIYQFSRPVENRLETEILFVGPAGVTGVTGVTGVKEIDIALSTFDPQIKIQEISENWPDWAVLDVALEGSGLRRMDSIPQSSYGGNSDGLKKPSSRFLVQDDSGQAFLLMSELRTARKKPVKLVLQGLWPEAKLGLLAERICRTLNRSWSQQALALAQLQRPYAEKVRAQLVKEPAGKVESLPQLAPPIQVTADLSLLSNYQRIRLIDQFMDKLENWPPEVIFAYPGQKNRTKALPSHALWILPFVVGAGFLVGILGFWNFSSSLAGKILGEQDLADIHPAASIYQTSLGSAELKDLLAASFAHTSRERPEKLAIFVPQSESDLIEKVRLAAEGAGHSFSRDGTEKAQVCLFPTNDPSSQIARLPSQGFGRILLTSKKAESQKIRHQLYQAEADLAGIPITDVILIEA
jgi:hypothetical protein